MGASRIISFYFLITLATAFPVFSQAQNTFQKIYFFNDSIGVIDDLYSTDSCFYISGTVPNYNNGKLETFFGTLDLEGNLISFNTIQDDSSDQISYFSYSELGLDVNGDFVFSFKNNGNAITAPRVLRLSSTGVVVSDTIFSDYVTNDSLYFFDGGRTVLHNSDSSLYFYYTYTDESSGSTSGETGVLLAKYKQNGDFVWEKRISHPSVVQDKPSYIVGGFTHLTDSTFLVSITEIKSYVSMQLEDQNTAKIHFYEFNSDGVELDHFVYQDGQYNIGRRALLKSSGKTIYSNFVTDYEPIVGSTQPTWRFFNAVTSLDESGDIIWKDTLSPVYVSFLTYSTPSELIVTSDSSFAGAFSYSNIHYNSDSSSFKKEFQIEFFNKLNQTGADIWFRRFHYFPEDSMRRVDYEMYDIEQTNDGGYILGGYALSYDSIDVGRPGQYGYVIKTNCLGYIGEPQAAFSYTIDNNTIVFSNESVLAGEYEWNFGDNNILLTEEGEIVVSHEYTESGLYTVELIAFGCNGESDAVSVDIDFEYDVGGYAGDGTLLTLYPNPVLSGDNLMFYIGNMNGGSNSIQITDITGRVIENILIEFSQANYTLQRKLPSGEYFFSVISDGKIVEVEKLIVVD